MVYERSPKAMRAAQAVDFLQSRLTSGGVQLSVSVKGRPLVDAAVGKSAGQPLGVGDLVRVWCSAKPIAACLLVALLKQRGRCLGDVVQTASITSEVTWGSLLNHSYGLASPDMMSALLMPRTSRRNACSLALDHPTEAPAYSEYVWASVVADGIAELSRQSAVSALQAFVDSIGLADDICYGVPSAERVAQLQWGQQNGRSNRHFRQRGIDFDAAAAGPFSNARGLVRFYDVVSGNAQDFQPHVASISEGLDEMLRTRRPRVYDPVLSRTCAFGAGFAVGLADHGYGELPSDSSFGHSGAMGSSWAFHDPAHGVSVAYTKTSCIFDTGLVDAERAAVVREVYGWL